MYVDKTLSLETANLIAGTNTWVTPDYLHNAIRSDGELIFNKLIELSNNHKHI